MAKKAKKNGAKRGRKPRPAEISEPSTPVAREVTIDSVMRDLSLIRATLTGLI